MALLFKWPNQLFLQGLPYNPLITFKLLFFTLIQKKILEILKILRTYKFRKTYLLIFFRQKLFCLKFRKPKFLELTQWMRRRSTVSSKVSFL